MLPMDLLKLYDVLIIGSGPAGLSAALSCARQFRRTLVLSASITQPFRNTAADHMHNVLGFDHVPPEEFRRTAKEQMMGRYADYVKFDDQAEVVAVEKMEEAVEGHQGVFKVRDIEGRQWTGRKLVLATGSRDVFPDIKGFDEVWGSGVIHCPYCHGYEQRGSRTAGFLYLSRDPSAIAAYLGSMALVVRFPRPSAESDAKYPFTIYLNQADEAFVDAFRANEGVKVLLKKGVEIDNRKIREMEMVPSPEGKTTEDDHGKDLKITFQDGSTGQTKFLLAHLPMTLSPMGTVLAKTFNLPLSPAGDMTDLSPVGESTQVPGLFVAGDMMTGLKAVSAATYNGCIAGVGATKALAMEDMMRVREEGMQPRQGKDEGLEAKQAGLGLGASLDEIEAQAPAISEGRDVLLNA